MNYPADDERLAEHANELIEELSGMPVPTLRTLGRALAIGGGTHGLRVLGGGLESCADAWDPVDGHGLLVLGRIRLKLVLRELACDAEFRERLEHAEEPLWTTLRAALDDLGEQ